jgi:hypothetical protein
VQHYSRENVNWLCSVGIAIFCLHVSAEASWTAEQLIDEAVIRKWKAYESFARKLQGKERHTSVSSESGGAEELRISRLVFKQNENCVSWIRSIEEENPTELISIANPQYAADLKRSGANLGDVVLQRYSETQERPKRGEPPVFERVLSGVSPHFYGSSRFRVGDFYSFGRLQVKIFSRRYSSSRKP